MTEWVSTPIKALVSVNDDVVPETYPAEDEIHYVEISDVSEGTIAWRDPILFGEAPSRARRRISEGDVLVSTVRTYLRAVARVDDAPADAVASTGFAVLRPARVDPRFLAYAMLNDEVLDQIVARSVGVSYPAINASDLVRIKISTPGMSRQVDIANFLDRETAEIDAFIADQEELIGLLTERRAATITHAVTKGLDPSAPMEDSASVWFPRLPQGWVLIPIGLGSVLIQTGPFGSQLHSEEYVDGGVPIVNPMHIVDGKIRASSTMSVTEEKAAELRRHALQAGDVIVARRGELGRCAVSSAENVGQLCGTGSAIIRLDRQRFVPEYFQLVFSSEQTRHALLQYSIGSTMDNLNADVVGALRIPCPPLATQQAIVDYLDHETAELDAAIADAREAIALSRERRAALISAAVTGKVDVRGLA